MKKQYLTILLMILWCSLFAQTQDYGYSENPNLSTYATNSTVRINGEFSVGELGNSTYTVPIEVPQGINNFQPNLALCYNSLFGNGVCGLGFNLIGLSIISRVTGNLYYENNTVDKIVNSKYWAMTLDGQRLITINNSTFYIENDPLSKIYFSGSETLIMEKDGFKYKYEKVNSNLDSYYLTTATDNYDNKIIYSYLIQDNYVYISKISYGEGSGATIINFGYEKRDDIVNIYDKVSVQIKNRLNQIEIIKNNILFKKYYLNYISGMNNVSEISMIKENYDNTKFKNPIYISWGEYNFNSIKEKQVVNIQNYSRTEFKNMTTVPGDFDGDGIDDLILITSNEKIPINGEYTLKSFVYFYKCEKGLDPVFTYKKSIDLGADIDINDMKNYQVAQFFNDFDGDGINELIIPNLNVNDSYKEFD